MPVYGDDSIEVKRMQNNERVVVIKGDESKWYSQIVCIMNPEPMYNAPVDLVAEAEKIINNYMAKKRTSPGGSIHAYLNQPYMPPTIIDAKQVAGKKKRVLFDFLFYGLMILACIAMAAVVKFGLLN